MREEHRPRVVVCNTKGAAVMGGACVRYRGEVHTHFGEET